MKNNMRIGFVGLTHLGLVSSICAAEKGFNLVCYDTKTNLIEILLSPGTFIFLLNGAILLLDVKILFT